MEVKRPGWEQLPPLLKCPSADLADVADVAVKSGMQADVIGPCSPQFNQDTGGYSPKSSVNRGTHKKNKTRLPGALGHLSIPQARFNGLWIASSSRTKLCRLLRFTKTGIREFWLTSLNFGESSGNVVFGFGPAKMASVFHFMSP